MDASKVFNILLFSWFICGAVTVLIFYGMASRKCRALNDRLTQLGEPERSWMNPQNLFQHRKELVVLAPKEYKAIAGIFIGWVIACVVLLILIQIIFFLAPMFIS